LGEFFDDRHSPLPATAEPSRPILPSSFSAKADIMDVTKYGTKSAISAGEESRPKNAAENFIIKVK
jgi:hypothetical protein